MKKPNKIILDGDILVWKTAFWADTEGAGSIVPKLKWYIKKWTPEGIDKVEVALSCKRRDNFRMDSYPKYKSNRDGTFKPETLYDTYEAIQDIAKCLSRPRLEADDIMGIYASCGKAIAVSTDKDMRGVRGWHWNPTKEDEPLFISKEEAERFFCIQWMAGDPTDGVPGLWRIGHKKAAKMLDELDPEDWHKYIMDAYTEEKYHKDEVDNPEALAIATGQCVRILHKENYNLKTNKITPWLPKVG